MKDADELKHIARMLAVSRAGREPDADPAPTGGDLNTAQNLFGLFSDEQRAAFIAEYLRVFGIVTRLIFGVEPSTTPT